VHDRHIGFSINRHGAIVPALGLRRLSATRRFFSIRPSCRVIFEAIDAVGHWSKYVITFDLRTRCPLSRNSGHGRT
jgi:hypothetical protein